MKKYIKLIFTFVLFATTVACTEGYEDYNPPYKDSSLQPLTSDWFIIALFPDGSPAYGGDYEIFTTANTSNGDSLWIDDHGNWMEIKTKVTADLNDLTFFGKQDAEEFITGGTITVSNGKIIKDAYTTTTESIVDSIYFEAEFDWDPGTVYKFAGHQRTGFLEDESPHF